MGDLQQLYDAVVEGNAAQARAIVAGALTAGRDRRELLDKYLYPAIDEAGRRVKMNEYVMPDLLAAARALKGALEVINA
ncbi:MAG: B12-binding domain-containing protein [Chloroflexi bacterium]|nr:B12-binding domain-containing protein [Chloroflexota bacterium]MCL5273142.1 B12-binding domain-containing protein [Chloroflexota bacterium]